MAVQLPESVSHTSDLYWESQVTSQGQKPPFELDRDGYGTKKRKEKIEFTHPMIVLMEPT